MDNYYLVIKALHIIAIISWMAGMLYLPRLYVYHARQKPGSETSEMLKIMERKLLRFIMNPAMIVSIILGIILMVEGKFMSNPVGAGWLHAKIFLSIFGMGGMHALLARYRKDFERDENKHSEKFYRIINEVPTALMMIIVFLVVVKPF